MEIPIDIQSAKIPLSLLTAPLKRAPAVEPEASLVDALWAQKQAKAAAVAWRRRVESGEAVKTLADAGVTVISSTHGRGILADSHRASLRSFHNSPSVEALISQCDFTLVAGSRLRSNETRSWTLELPTPRVQIDIDPAAASRNYLMDNTGGGLPGAISGAGRRVQGRIWGDARWDSQLKEAVEAAELRDQCGDYAKLNDAIAQALPDDGIGARYYRFWQPVGQPSVPRSRPADEYPFLAGAIGMGLPMAVGTAIANPQRKVVGTVGDGGLSLNLGELATGAGEGQRDAVDYE